jgi:hypothetical protein
MKHEAKAIGSGSEAAQAELQDQYTKVRLPCTTLRHLRAQWKTPRLVLFHGNR